MMQHLGYLKAANYLMATFYVIAGLAIFPLCFLALAIVPAELSTGDWLPMLGAGAFGMTICFTLAGFAVVMARRVSTGRWRLPQTVWAILTLANNPPIGLLYGVYALWVCWGNAETRAAFERAG